MWGYSVRFVCTVWGGMTGLGGRGTESAYTATPSFRRKPESSAGEAHWLWIPAFAGMTGPVRLKLLALGLSVPVYYGKVKDGTGYQVLFPKDVQPGDVLKFIEEVNLK